MQHFFKYMGFVGAWLPGTALVFFSLSCWSEKKQDHAAHLQQKTSHQLYACPMPEDSFFSDKPGICPQCGMELEKKEEQMSAVKEITLDALLKPANEFVIASLPVIAVSQHTEPIETEAPGYTAYNTSSVGQIAARISGRIERLYVKYRYQKINKGQKIMDIYSPELVTAQQNLLFLLKNDKENERMIEAARQRLLLLGFSDQQLLQLTRTGNPSLTVSVYSNYSGHIHEAGDMPAMSEPGNSDGSMGNFTQTTRELRLKEGMYIQKGQSIFSVYDSDGLWILLNIYPQDQVFVRTGDKVRFSSEIYPGKEYEAAINYIEPFFRERNKTIAARVNFNNSSAKLPVGSQVRATIYSGNYNGFWLPKEAVLSLGLNKVVFLREKEGFKVHKIEIGLTHKDRLQVLSGLHTRDSVAANAQYLIDSESFIKLTTD